MPHGEESDDEFGWTESPFTASYATLGHRELNDKSVYGAGATQARQLTQVNPVKISLTENSLFNPARHLEI